MENILSAVKANIQKVLVGEERVTSLLLTALADLVGWGFLMFELAVWHIPDAFEFGYLLFR